MNCVTICRIRYGMIFAKLFSSHSLICGPHKTMTLPRQTKHFDCWFSVIRLLIGSARIPTANHPRCVEQPLVHRHFQYSWGGNPQRCDASMYRSIQSLSFFHFSLDVDHKRCFISGKCCACCAIHTFYTCLIQDIELENHLMLHLGKIPILANMFQGG